jgi:hypothetical protein
MGKTRFLNKLSADDKIIFKDATLENLYYDASNVEGGDRQSDVRITINKLRPLIAALEDVGKALDTFSQIGTTIFSSIWRVFRLCLCSQGHTTGSITW